MTTQTARDAASPKWRRRAITIPGYCFAFAILALLLPLAIPFLLLVDIFLRNGFTSTRLYLLALAYLGCEVCGVVVSAVLFIRWRLSRSPARDAFIANNFRLQWWWGRTLAGALFRILRVRLTVHAPFEYHGRPILVFARHASFIDSLLPNLLVAAEHRIQLRYVLKKQLLWDPCLDIVGNRIPNCFLERGGHTEEDVEKIRRLADGLGSRGGVLIFPEGTRFTPEKKARILGQFREKGETDSLDRAELLQHLLPPRLAGTLALLEHAGEADCVFCAHAGLEALTNIRALLSGALRERQVHVSFRTVPRENIPTGINECTEWFHQQWFEVDRTVDAFTDGGDRS